jgi:glycosyltransferase involved in cell wall biosynthesis
MTTLSVAMATYNGARYIRRQLDSLVAQTRRPDELVVTDDGSADDTLALLADFARVAPFPVRVHRNATKLGYKANFVQCAGLCTGDLIAFCDQDDVWLPGKLALQSQRLAEPGVLLSTHRALLIDAEEKSLGRTFQQFRMPPRFTFENATPFCYNLGFTLVFRRELLRFSADWPLSVDENEVGEPMAHDQWFCFLASTLGSIRFDAELLAHYRQHGANASGSRLLPNRAPLARGITSERISEYRRREVAAASRRDQLARMANLAETPQRERLTRASEVYESYEAALRRRRNLFETASSMKGLGLLSRALLQGDYRADSNWHFGLRSAVRDVLMLVKRPLLGGV